MHDEEMVSNFNHSHWGPNETKLNISNELNSAGQRRCHRIGTPNIYLCAGALKNKKAGQACDPLLLEGSVFLLV